MSDMKWTPGPWALSRYHHPHRDIVQRTGEQDNDARPGNRLICAVRSRKKSEQAANAHLIAAAPLVYARLEKTTEHLHRLLDEVSDESYEVLLDMIEENGEALSQARGKTGGQS